MDVRSSQQAAAWSSGGEWESEAEGEWWWRSGESVREKEGTARYFGVRSEQKTRGWKRGVKTDQTASFNQDNVDGLSTHRLQLVCRVRCGW